MLVHVLDYFLEITCRLSDSYSNREFSHIEKALN